MKSRTLAYSLAIISTGLLFACAVNYAIDGSNLGFTYCENNVPVSWINTSVMGTPLEAGTVAHERKHIEQILRFESCAQFEAYAIQVPELIEAEAFCEDVKIEVRRGMPYPVALYYYADWMTNGGYSDQFVMSVDSGAKLIHRFCQ